MIISSRLVVMSQRVGDGRSVLVAAVAPRRLLALLPPDEVEVGGLVGQRLVDATQRGD